MDAAKAEHPGRPVELRAFDEHRLGLKPLIRRVWAKRGQRPVAVSTHKYQWLYLYGFVRPRTGAVEWWVADGIGVDLFQQVLNAFARDIGAGADKTVILVLDNAGWHTSPKLDIPDGIRFCFLPSYTPELQPAEHLWPFLDEPLVNRYFQTIEELDAAVAERCLALMQQVQTISASTLFHWWPRPTTRKAL